MLEIWNANVVSEKIPSSTKALLILLISAIVLQKISIFCQNSIFTQSNSVRVVLAIF